MKDKVFIVWSGTSDVALDVKKILEEEYDYSCRIGGNSDNSSDFSSVGDVVIQQMKECNQAIIIFQNRADGSVSNNLFFELGYTLSMYGQKKIHCVKMQGDSIVLPSDFDNSFVEEIKCMGDAQEFPRGIVDYFIGRQKMSINEDKMFLINNRYMIHDKLESHYSESGSKCSDYELAQYILYYMQAAEMFGDVENVYNEIKDFKSKHTFKFSDELAIAVNLCISFFEMYLNIKENTGGGDVYLDKSDFWKFIKDGEHYLDILVSDKIGVFDEWAKVFITELLGFGYMLLGNNESFAQNLRTAAYQKCIEYSQKALENIVVLTETILSMDKDNHDEKGLIAVFKSYIFRNLYIAKGFLGEEDATDWLEKGLKTREALKNNYSRGSIDTQLYNKFCMEYYLLLISYLDEHEKDGSLDPFEVMMYKSEISEYLASVKKSDNETAFLHQIQHWCEK